MCICDWPQRSTKQQIWKLQQVVEFTNIEISNRKHQEYLASERLPLYTLETRVTPWVTRLTEQPPAYMQPSMSRLVCCCVHYPYLFSAPMRTTTLLCWTCAPCCYLPSSTPVPTSKHVLSTRPHCVTSEATGIVPELRLLALISVTYLKTPHSLLLDLHCIHSTATWPSCLLKDQ